VIFLFKKGGIKLTIQTLPIRLNLNEEIYKKLADGLAYDIRVAMPGVIQSWNPTTQTAVIQLSIAERINLSGNLSWEQIPLLVDVPLVTIKGGGHLIATAINPGDECWVWFADCCHDAAWQNSGVNNVQSEKRRHDLSDGFFMPSLFSQPKVIPNYPTTGIQIRDAAGDTMVSVVNSTINIAASGTVNVTGATVNINNSSSNTINLNGRNFLSHQHSGIQIGSSNSGGVV
jgi:hypothetical protein